MKHSSPALKPLAVHSPGKLFPVLLKSPRRDRFRPGQPLFPVDANELNWRLGLLRDLWDRTLAGHTPELTCSKSPRKSPP